MTVRVEMGFDQTDVARVVRRLRALAQDLEPVVRAFGGSIARQIDRNFAVGGIPPWAPNRPNTIAAKGHGKVLIRSGALRAGIQVHSYKSGSETGIDIRVPQIGIYAHRGTQAHLIRPKTAGGRLAFTVAEARGATAARRRGTAKRRKSGLKARASSRAQGVTAFAQVVHHPGTPARRLITFTRGFLDTAWHQPVERFLGLAS